MSGMTTERARLRVAFIDQTGDDSGGAQESFALLLRHLPAHIDAHVLVFHDGKYAARLRSEGFEVSVLAVPEALTESKREKTSLGGIAALPGAIGRLAVWLRRRRVDLVYTHTVKAHFIGAPAARMAGIPCVMHLRDILEGRPRAALRSVASLCARERIAISKGVAQTYGLRATTVVWNPLDLDAYRALPSRQEAWRALGLAGDPNVPTVGIVGRINRWKGQDTFVRVAAALGKQIPARFLVVGSAIFRDAEFAEELKRMVREMDLEERVTFVPWIEDVRNVYAVLDVHANCSDREPFGRSVMEAAACGVPSVCFSDAGVSEVLTDRVDGRIVPKGDEGAFTQAVSELLDPGKRSALRSAASLLAQRFDPGAHAAQVASILVRAAA